MQCNDDGRPGQAEVAPDCTVPFDERAGCGVNVERLLSGQRTLIGITFVTRSGTDLPHDLTLDQARLLLARIADAIRDAQPSVSPMPVQVAS